MCGRYTLTRHDDVIEDLEASLGDTAQGEWWKPRFNVAPTQPAPVVITSKDGARLVELMRWGLVPFWGSKPGAKPPLMINARVEGLAEKAMFRDALDRRRCLVPADGFFEWKRDKAAPKSKPQPLYFRPNPRHLICFAGLWAKAKTDAGDLLSFTIVTGPPNDLVRPIHDRMPVVLAPSAYAAWLDPSLPGDEAKKLLGIPPVDDWVGEPVSVRVNNAKLDDETMIEPLGDEKPPQGSLF